MNGSTIGIDPSVARPAIAIWPARETWQLKIEGQGSERFMALCGSVRDWAYHHAPDDLLAVFIERPTNSFPKPALYQANGIIQVGVLSGQQGRFRHPVSCFELSPGTWKKHSIGKGNAKKDDVWHWAVGEIGIGSSVTQDECDALAIARAGHALLEQGADLG